MSRRLSVLTLSLLIICGCRTVMTPKQAFFTAYPEHAKRYIQLDETSLALMETAAGQQQRSIESVLAGVRARASNDCPAMLPGIDGSWRTSQVFYQGDMERVAELRRAFDERTDHLFYYHRLNPGEQFPHERGWLILRRGEVLKTLPLSFSVAP